ncbi:alpha-ketoacid dehydrogenase subunit beta [Patescibacteria group bacterium]|nr:alpha-ketoacid dehydrogenase subunit beta [Patescibacteria group bacterium]
MAKINLIQSIKSTLQQEMEKDKRVILLGEDVGRNGGVFRVTEGLWQKFGDNRVIDTPLAEVGIISVSIGLAVAGLKPVPEVQFDGFSISMIDQIYNHVGRIRKRSQGKYSVPLVLRIPHGGGIKAYEHHSESLETFFSHIPGIKVVTPSGPYNAKGLLASAIRDPDPVIFLEPKRVYRAIKEEVPEKEYTIPLQKSEVVQEGNDITVIAWGAMQRVVKEAARELSGKYSIEIIDLLTISPLDRETIIYSVKKTGRCVVVQEAPKTCGFGAELITIIQEGAFLSLKAPLARVTGYDIPMPLAKLENYYIPDETRINKAIEKVMSF